MGLFRNMMKIRRTILRGATFTNNNSTRLLHGMARAEKIASFGLSRTPYGKAIAIGLQANPYTAAALGGYFALKHGAQIAQLGSRVIKGQTKPSTAVKKLMAL